MHHLAITLTFLEIAIFLVAFVAFLLAVRFFIASIKNLQNLLPSKKRNSGFSVRIDKDGFIVPATTKSRKEKDEPVLDRPDETKQEIKELRDMLQLQQLELTRAMRQIESFHTKKEPDVQVCDATTDQ